MTKKSSGRAGSSSRASAKSSSSRSRGPAASRGGRSGSGGRKSIARFAQKGARARQKAAGRKPGSQPLTERNSDTPWNEIDVLRLQALIEENTPTRLIGLQLGRTEDAVYKKSAELGLSLKPTNQSPRG
jgi:hypothetical protein